MKKQISFFVIIAILIGIGIGVLAWDFFTPSLAEGVFYYLVDGSKAKLFLISGKDEPKEIISLPAREVDFGKYNPPRHSYFSHDSKQMIYFKKIGEIPLEDFTEDESIVVSRVVSEPMLVNLKTGKETKIEQPIDSSSLVFSPSDEKIAWIKEVKESTYDTIEESEKRREIWISRADGQAAELLTDFDENVILLKLWYGDYIYFQGFWDATIRSLGRINTKTKKIDYLVPRYCEKFLENCSNIELSVSGRKFLYEIYEKDDKEITELYLGDFDKKEFQAILTTDRISDRLWFNNEKEFIYTEQEVIKGEGTKETIHLVDINKETDEVLYAGSYVSQLTPDPSGRFLYFLEEENDGESFKLIRLDVKTKETETILTEDYNHILLIK